MKTSQIRLLVLLSLASLASLVGLRSLIACDPTTATIQWQVTVPAGTPEQAKIFLAGNHELFGPWKPNVFPLEKRADGTYHAQAQLPIGMKLEYKFTRGDWDAVEKSERGSEIPNRTLLVQKDTTVQVTIASWANRLTPTLSTATGDLRWKDFDSQILHGQRRVTVWLPPGYRTSPMDRFPVLYMLDGQNVFDAARAAFGVEWQADEAARDLFFSKPSRPLIIVAIDNSRERMNEYTPVQESIGGNQVGGDADKYLRFLVEEIKPWIDDEFRTRPDPANTSLAGSSLGGLFVLFGIEKRPDIFGKGIAMSPSLFWGTECILETYRHPRPTDIPQSRQRLWLDMGTMEGNSKTGQANAVEQIKRFEKILIDHQANRFEFKITIEDDGKHHESAWARRLPSALNYLFPLSPN